jgi:putative transposase
MEGERNRSMNENAEVIDVTGLRQNPQALKKLLIDQIRARGGTAAVDSKSIVQDLMKQTLEAFLELEMEEHLGYPPHAAEGRGSGNSRNGTTARTVRGDFGEVAIETPRDRKGEFDPKIVARRKPRWKLH